MLLVKQLLCLCQWRHTTEHEMQGREFPCTPEIPISFIHAFSHGNAGEICGKSHLKVPEGWCTKAFPGMGNKCLEGSSFADPDFVFLYTLETPENPIGSSWTPGISAHMQHLETWSIVEVAATYSYLFVSILTSSFAALHSPAWQIFRSCSYVTLRQNWCERIQRDLWPESPLIPGFPPGLFVHFEHTTVICWGISALASLGTHPLPQHRSGPGFQAIP